MAPIGTFLERYLFGDLNRRSNNMSRTKNDFMEAMRIIQRIFRKRRESELALVQNQSKCMHNTNNTNNLTKKDETDE